LLYALVVYHEHATDEPRPAWRKVKGTRFLDPETLLQAGIRDHWDDYLKVMVSSKDLNERNVQREKSVPKKRGPKPKKKQ